MAAHWTNDFKCIFGPHGSIWAEILWKWIVYQVSSYWNQCWTNFGRRLIKHNITSSKHQTYEEQHQINKQNNKNNTNTTRAKTYMFLLILALSPYAILSAQGLAQLLKILSTKTRKALQLASHSQGTHKVRTNKKQEPASSKHNAFNPK